LRREAWEASRFIAKSLTEAFIAANDCFAAAQRGFPYATPWLEAELEDTAAVMGEDFHPYGLERNRAQIDAFAAEAFRLGFTSRQITTEEYFADYLKGGVDHGGPPRVRRASRPGRRQLGEVAARAGVQRRRRRGRHRQAGSRVRVQPRQASDGRARSRRQFPALLGRGLVPARARRAQGAGRHLVAHR